MIFQKLAGHIEIKKKYIMAWGFPGGTVKNQPADVGDTRDAGLIPGLGRCPGEGNGNPLQYSCLGNPWTEKPGGLQSIGLQKVRHD